jgi:acetylglutamate kinase
MNQHQNQQYHYLEDSSEASDRTGREPYSGKTSTHRGTIVVKIGGSTFGEKATIIRDVVNLQQQGYQPVLVHGGGKVISEWMGRQGVRPRFVRGLRVTDATSLDIVIAVLTGVVNKGIVASLNSLGGKAIGLSGVDGGLLHANILNPELGFVGKISRVDTAPIKAIINAGFIPVIAPVAIREPNDVNQPLLNINADTAAGAIALSLAAHHLLLLTDVEGVLDTSHRLIPRLTKRQALDLTQSQIVGGGMLPKLEACLTASDAVEATHIVDGRAPGILIKVLSGERVGTRVG